VRYRRTGIVVLLALGLAGCGSSDKPAGLTTGQAQALVSQLEAARVTAAAGDVATTKATLAKFRRSVARLERDGALSDATARALRTGAQRVLRRVGLDNSAPAAPAEPPAEPTTTTTAPAPPAKGKKDEKKHGKGEKKHGKKK
jgi:hypothetical protein